jgi:hypothetical protein
MLSNIHQIRSFGVDVTYYSEMHSDFDEGTIKKIQASNTNASRSSEMNGMRCPFLMNAQQADDLLRKITGL